MRGVLVVLFHDLFGQAAFLGHFEDQFLIVVGIAEPFRHAMGDGSTAAAKFAAECDDALLHTDTSFFDGSHASPSPARRFRG